MLALSFCKHHEIKFFASKVHHKCSQFRSEHQCFLLVSTPSKVRVVRTRHLDQIGESLVLKFQGLILLIFFSQLSLLFFNSSLPSGFTFFCLISSFISFFLDSNNAFSLSFFSITGLITSVYILLAVEYIVTRPVLSTANNLSVTISAST